MGAKFSINEIASATGGVLGGSVNIAGFEGAASLNARLSGISTDTRTLRPGDAFFALKGENHDAHDHLDEAVAAGAAVLVVSDADKAPAGYEGAVLVVEDTLYAYQELAAYYREKLDPLVIAVTGSVGKTTLKDMIACVLEGKARVCKTRGNLNNQIGLPRTILEAGEDVEIFVLEMGMAGAGEIRRLVEIARPNIAAITNIGFSHRENFDTDDGILMAKFEIASLLGAGDALVIDAGGNKALVKLAEEGADEKGYRLLRIAESGTTGEGAPDCDYMTTPARIDMADTAVSLFEISDRKTGKATPFAIPLPGAYAGISAALAVAVCMQAGAGVSPEGAAEALSRLERTPHRLEPVMKNGVLIIDDTYNSSPDSAKSGLKYLENVPAKRRFAALAGMNELGSASDALHFEIGKAAVAAGADFVYTYGAKALRIADGAEAAAAETGAVGAGNIAGAKVEVKRFGENEKAGLIERLYANVKAGDAVYVKGSRTMKMEEVVLALMEKL